LTEAKFPYESGIGNVIHMRVRQRKRSRMMSHEAVPSPRGWFRPPNKAPSPPSNWNTKNTTTSGIFLKFECQAPTART